jgi:hypothetical protein
MTMLTMPYGGWGVNHPSPKRVMSEILKAPSMKSFLKSSRKTGSKKYLGVIGSYLMEILDDEPVIIHLLKDSAYHYSPSMASRFSGPDKRLILTTFLSDALLIFSTTKENDFGDVVELLVFVNNSVITSATLLKEAERLASLRWPVATLQFKSSSQETNHLFLQAGWLLLPNQNEVLIKFMGSAAERDN